MAVAAALVLLPIRALFWTIKHPKVLIALVICIGVLFGVRACSSAFASHSSPAPKQVAIYQDKAPTLKEAPYVLATSTRIYYVVLYTKNGDTYTLSKYYTYDKDKWILRTVPLVVDKKYYGEVRFYERKD